MCKEQNDRIGFVGEHMKFAEKLQQKSLNILGTRTPLIAFLGDSVTQGCFECYMRDGQIDTVFQSGDSYPEKVKRILSMLYPRSSVSIINFGVSGSTAVEGAKRLERDVLSCSPDLLIVCFGLNDSNEEYEGIEKYKIALKEIFSKAKKAGIETIFMTPNMFNTYVSYSLKEEMLIALGKIFEKRQNEGLLDLYMDAAREACKEEDVAICDCYAIWKDMYNKGVDTTELLANGLNHPTREMHELFAWQLVHTILNH